MLENYLPILIFIVIGFGFGCVPVIAGKLLGPNKPDDEKLSAFECGFAPFEDARIKFDVRFYLLAILFIIFDLEIAFLYPWAIVFKELPWPGIIAMGIFLLELIVGFVYIWKKGALEWE